MFLPSNRILFIGLCVSVCGESAFGQGLGAYLPLPGPRPGYFPQVPIVGTFSPQVPPAAIVPRNVIGHRSAYWGGGFGLGGGYGYPYFGYGIPFGYDPGLSMFQDPGPAQPEPLIGAGGPPDRYTVPLSNQFPAELTVLLPKDGQLWVNGVLQTQTQSQFRLKSNPLLRGTVSRFEIRARWVVDGQTFEATRTVAVQAGDSTKFTIVSGDPIPSGDRAAQSRP
ncbi:MAG: TIGR03000 domain-containing protein [Bacteroidales bacterium]|nr:TIGR03000 domain-containing protein [Bacteroidales bacterium]